MRYIGVDPGQNLGIVCVDVVKAERRIGNQLTIKWVGQARVHPSRRENFTPAEDDGRVFDRVQLILQRWREDTGGMVPALPLISVLEEPYTHMRAWAGGRAQGRGTAFGLGKYYGLALAACISESKRVYSHPPTNDRKQQRTGWMQGSGRIQKRELTILALRGLAIQYGCTALLSEDEVMAFGVLKFHLDRFGLEAE